MSEEPLPTDELFQVERQIAQRADELDRCLGIDRGHALDHWRQAEREILGITTGELEFEALHH